MSSGRSDIVECTIRRVVREGSELENIVRKLAELFGQGEEVDVFVERLVFSPYNEAGNMNLVHRESLVGIEYMVGKDVCNLTYYGAPVILASMPSSDKAGDAFTVTSVEASTNVRRTLLKAGFVVKADHAKKGLRFKTRRLSQEILISRPYNASLMEEKLYREGMANWESLAGGFPFGQNYLLELKQNVLGASTPEDVVRELQDLANKLET